MRIIEEVDENSVYNYLEKEEYACGPEAARIALSLLGIEKTEDELISLLGSNIKIGTSISHFPTLFEKMKLDYIVSRYSSVEELRMVFDLGYKIIVRYHMPQYDEDHYTVIKDMNDQVIYFLDPWYGNNYMSLKNFNELWGQGLELGNEYKWLIGIKQTIKRE